MELLIYYDAHTAIPNKVQLVSYLSPLLNKFHLLQLHHHSLNTLPNRLQPAQELQEV